MLHVAPCNFAALPECLHLPVPVTPYMYDVHADGCTAARRLHWLPDLVKHTSLLMTTCPEASNLCQHLYHVILTSQSTILANEHVHALHTHCVPC